MDDDIKHKFAPRRNKRYRHLPQFNELCRWAEGLDWRNNDAHFMVLAKRVLENLDDKLREERGMRIDQMAGWDELLGVMRYASCRYRPEYRNIFIYLRLYVHFYLGDHFIMHKPPKWNIESRPV
jgi:hypothetical protein